MTSDPTGPTAFREPENQVSPRAMPYWRLSTLLGLIPVLGIAVPILIFLPERPWWLWALAALAVVPPILVALLMPPIRFRVHRWEITDEAVFTRSGWLTRTLEIIPLNRVQTIERQQGFLMRQFDLASVTVTTASSAGEIVIACLEQSVAERAVAELTTITGATEGDAT